VAHFREVKSEAEDTLKLLEKKPKLMLEVLEAM
jgi:hypothetical protein